MKKNLLSVLPLLIALLCAMPLSSAAQHKKKKKQDNTEVPETKKDEYTELLNKCNKFEGLFNVYQDSTDGSSYLAVKKDQLNKDYIYFSYSENGVAESGHYRGGYRSGKIIRFEKYYDRIEIYSENTAYYFDPENEVSKSSDANINRPFICSEVIKVKNDSVFVISGDALFLSEKMGMIKRPGSPSNPSFLGSLSKEKSKIERINNYPENTEITVSYVFDNPSPKNSGSAAVTDARYISIQFQHSLLAIPENNFEARKDDGRIGYFSTQITDLTSFENAPYRDVIHRWHLEKKDPEAALSEPVTPITYWLENTTPLDFRETLKLAVESWNSSFEKIGFKNAIVVKIQPDSATWDAGDIRYNVIRWTASPSPIFGGYGPSFVNPRNGQILGADIMLELSALGNRYRKTQIFRHPAEDLQDWEEDGQEEMDMTCYMGPFMQHNYAFGQTALASVNTSTLAKDEFIKQTLYRLALHEVGHTLGMSHNMRGSTLHGVEALKDKSIVDRDGLSNSIMDYPAINFALHPEDQTLYYDIKPGIYDDWVIAYGYSPSLPEALEEDKRLEAILARSSEAQLAFGNDADDMRAIGKGMDPDVNIFDLSSDPVAYASERCELVLQILPNLIENTSAQGKSYQDLYASFSTAFAEYIGQLNIMSRQIGGIHYDRTHIGQNALRKPLEPVSEERQEAAMDALYLYAFSPEAFDVPTDIYNHLLVQRRGFNHSRDTQDPKIHAQILSAQDNCLKQLLHPTVLTRIVDSELYGNTYLLSDMMMDLTDNIFMADLNGAVNSKRQALQVTYLKHLIGISAENSKYETGARSMAWHELNRIDELMTTGSKPDTQTSAHRNFVKKLIQDAREK